LIAVEIVRGFALLRVTIREFMKVTGVIREPKMREFMDKDRV
jgi:hypothetical protein